METGAAPMTIESMDASGHRRLCTIELIAEGRAERCPGGACPFWGEGCVLDNIEHELSERRGLASYLLELRRNLEHARRRELESAGAAFRRRLAAGRE